MKMKITWILLALALAVALGAFQWQRTRGSAANLNEASANGTAMPGAAAGDSAKPLPLVTLSSTDIVTVETTSLAQVLAISGPVKAINSAFVKARLAGELQDLLVREGDYVKAGQVIARIDNTEYQARLRQAQQQAQSAKAQVDIAQRTYDNNRSLVDQGFISKTALEIFGF